MKGQVEILDGGLLTTVQDNGRFGYRKFGIPVSGVMDDHAYHLANRLVANHIETPVLEFTIQGGVFKFHSQAVIGITGAMADVFVNDDAFQVNKTLKIEKGDIVEISRVKSGCRIYMAIAGEWEIENTLGSASTCLSASFGGFKGRKLKNGDMLSWNSPRKEIEIRKVPKQLIPHYSGRQHIRMLPGPEWDWLTEEQKAVFLETDFSVLSQSNRMGLKLKSEFKLNPKKEEMQSAPVVPGIIQLPQDGNPIVLMKDAQSVGGYPRIAKVIEADLWRLGQVWTSNKIRFKLVRYDESLELKRHHINLLSTPFIT